MANLIGEYSCSLDSKGRLVLPSALKRQMGTGQQDGFVVKRDIFSKCLVLFPMDEWERQNRIIRSKINPYNREHAQFVRSFFKGTAELNLDNTNRLLIPKRLLEEVGAGKEVILSGQFNKIEVWPKETYEQAMVNDDDFAVLAEKILGGLNLESSAE